MSDTTNESVQSIAQTLTDVEAVLSRMSAGTYRQCEVCGSEIGDELLVSEPLRSNCAEHPRLSAE
jgi:RNA polymerase-binding transcription factor DksA